MWQVNVMLGRRGHDALGQLAAIVFGEPVLPFEKVSNGLRFDPDFDAAQAGEQPSQTLMIKA